MIRKYTSNLNDFYKRIFDNSSDLNDTLFKYDLLKEEALDVFVNKVISLFLEDKRFNVALSSNSSSTDIYASEYNKYRNDLKYEKESFLYDIQVMLVNYFDLYLDWTSSKNSDFYIQLMFTFIYGNIKNYFFENRKRFLPEYDWFLIENNDKKKAHIEGFFREFDKFSDIISYMTNLKDIDDTPEDKIAYLSAILGLKFDLEDDSEGYANMPNGIYKIELLSVPKIRNLLNGLLEVYRTKGSQFSYEIFFNSVGIDISLEESYFDRRLFWKSKNDLPVDRENNETGAYGIDNFFYYITKNNPATTYLSFAPNEKVKTTDMTSPKSEKSFNHLFLSSERTEESLKNILGYGKNPIDEPYTYFKTNILLLNLKYFMTETEEESYISTKHLALLEEYINMITPIYIRKYSNKVLSSDFIALDKIDLYFYSGNGYEGYYEYNKNGERVYAERERSEGYHLNYDNYKSSEENEPESSLEEENLDTEEKEGFPKPADEEYEEHKDNSEIAHKVRDEEAKIGFNTIYPNESLYTEEFLYSFENVDGYILNNIDFTWLPKIIDKDLSQEGYFILEYNSYENPIVAVGAQNIGEVEIEIGLEDSDE